MFWLYYFMLIACFLGFILSLFETFLDDDIVTKFVHGFYSATFAVAGVIISGLI